MTTTTIQVDDIARVCHEANRAMQINQADPTIPVSPSWDELDAETRASATDGVVAILDDGVTLAVQS